MKRLLLCRGGMYFPDESCMKQNFFMLGIIKSQRQNKGGAWRQAGIQRQETMWLLRQLEGGLIFCGGSPGWAALNLPLAFTTGKKGRREKSLIQSFCIFYLHASEQKRFSSLCIRTYTWAILATACDSCKLSVQIPEESGQTFGRGIHCWEGKGELLIRPTASSSGNPLSCKCLKAVWMLGRKYFIFLPCSCFTLDIHLLPFLGKRFWTLIRPSAVSLALLGGIFLTAGQSSWWILKKNNPKLKIKQHLFFFFPSFRDNQFWCSNCNYQESTALIPVPVLKLVLVAGAGTAQCLKVTALSPGSSHAFKEASMTAFSGW